MISANSVFELICAELQLILVFHGFSKSEDEYHPETFGSRFVAFDGPKEKIRIIWDGKEQFFVIETIPIDSITYRSGRADIILRFFRAEDATDERVSETVSAMSVALSDYLISVDL
jgi:hypothetical protein